MSDPTAGGQPSPEELQAYLAQLREADIAEVVVQAFNMLATGAQVKLGRRDARMVIDGMDALVGATAGGLDDELAGQMRSAVAQLKSAQVQAESEVAAEGQGGGPTAAATGGAGAAGPGSGTGGAPTQPGGAQPGGGDAAETPGEGRLTDRLWVPGRGPAR